MEIFAQMENSNQREQFENICQIFMGVSELQTLKFRNFYC